MTSKGLSVFVLALGMLIFSEAHADTTTLSKAWPISGTDVLEEKMRGLVKFYPKPLSPPRDPVIREVGQNQTLWARDFSLNSFYQVEATYRAVGEFCYVLVEDSQWNVRVDSAAVADLVNVFDESCNADSTRGMYQIELETFGTPPDVDGDPRVTILVLDIRDNFSGSGSYYAGYFHSLNEYPPDTPGIEISEYSNFREMLYIDCDPLVIESDNANRALSHELQHLIHWGQDPDEEHWINEGCSGYAEYICGYRDRRVGDNFLAAPNNSLTIWDSKIADYEQTFMFIAYLAEKYGGEQTITELVAGDSNGIASVNEVLQSKGATFTSVFSDWVIANYLDQDGKYGYQEFDLPTDLLPATVITSLPDTVQETEPLLEYWAAEYIELPVVSAIKMDFQKTSTSDFLLQVIKQTGGQTSVIDLPFVDNIASLSVSDYDFLTLVAVRRSGYPGPYECAFEELPNGTEVAEVESEGLPDELLLAQNFPNPFNATTTIRFSLPSATSVTLDIFNNNGQRVAGLLDKKLQQGEWIVRWDGTDDRGKKLGSGIYFYRLQTTDYVQTRPMVLLK